LSTITVPTTLTAISSTTFGVPVANQLNQGTDYLFFTPAGSTNSPAGPATWITLGNLTVPAWAASARIQINCVAIAGSAAAASANLQIKLGTVGGTLQSMPAPNGTTRFTAPIYDKLTGITTGSQSLTIQSTNVSGNLSADTTSHFVALIDYLG